jgi:hypothetical protein
MNPRGRAQVVAVGLTAVALVVALMASPAAAKKKGGKKGGGRLDVTKAVNLPIPDRPTGADAQVGILDSTIEAPKQFKGKLIRDVNVTVQTLGTTPYNPMATGPASQIRARLTAPNGAHTTLFSGRSPAPLGGGQFALNQSIGPLTLDDESPLALGDEQPHNPRELYAPWAGRARPAGKQLAVMDNGPVAGTWTLTMADVSALETSNLVSWRIEVATGKPFLTK